jgi:PPP family 3-phenylpropionic acid transporter
MRALLKRPTFRWFLATTAMLQGSHAMLYAFGSPHWHDHGIDATTIGWLWAIGVIAEIALFSLGPRLVGRLSPMRLLTAAALGGLVRWPVLGLTTQLAFVFPAQVLHALTFGALHLGAMEYVRRTIEPQATGTATALYAATSGVALGIGVPAVGMLYESLQGSTYMVMAVCSGVSLLGLLMLRLSGKRSLAA